MGRTSGAVTFLGTGELGRDSHPSSMSNPPHQGWGNQPSSQPRLLFSTGAHACKDTMASRSFPALRRRRTGYLGFGADGFSQEMAGPVGSGGGSGVPQVLPSFPAPASLVRRHCTLHFLSHRNTEEWKVMSQIHSACPVTPSSRTMVSALSQEPETAALVGGEPWKQK